MNDLIVSITLLVAFAATSSYGYNCGFYDCNVGNYCCNRYGYYSKSCHSIQPSGYFCTTIYSSFSSGSGYNTYSYVSLGVGAIVGISLGTLALIIGGIVACVYCCKRGRSNQGRVIGGNQQVVPTTTTAAQQPGTVYPYKQEVPQQGYGQQQNIAMTGAAPPPQQGYPQQGYNQYPPAYSGQMEEMTAPYPTYPSAPPH